MNVVIDELRVEALVDVLRVRPGDTVVVNVSHELTQEQALGIREAVVPHVPAGVGVLVTVPSVELAVVEAAS